MTINSEAVFKAKTYDSSCWRDEAGSITVHKPDGKFVKVILKAKTPHRQITANLNKEDLVALLKELTA